MYYDTTSLEFGRLTQDSGLVCHVLVGEGGHESVRSGGTCSVGAVDKVVDVADRVGGVEA